MTNSKDCVEIRNALMGLQRRWHQLISILLQETLIFTPRVPTKNIPLPDDTISLHWLPCIMLGCVLIMTKVSLATVGTCFQENDRNTKTGVEGMRQVICCGTAVSFLKDLF